MKIIKWNESFAVVLPKQICVAFKWNKGKKLQAKITAPGKLELSAE